MNSISKIIAKFRKDAGLTQEQLANMLGVTAQAVSKWENGTTMPDIMLLPIIADVFNTDIDSLFGRNKKTSETNLTQNNIHEEAYKSILNMLQSLWGNAETRDELTKKTEEVCEYIKTHPDTQTMVLSNCEGNGIFADCNLALILNKNKDELFSLFNDDTAWTVLKRFTDGNTREVYKFIIENNKKSFTSSIIASNCELELSAVDRALNHLLCLKLISRMDVDTGDGIVYVYSAWATHKLILVYSMLAIASRLGNYSERYRGFLS